METMNTTEMAFSFLSRRLPSDLGISQSNYTYLLMDFQDKKGDEALEALAGAYVYIIDNMAGEKQSSAILEIFRHDLGERNDEFSLPRSSSYRQFWLAECEKRN